jgi:hypothetical protein
VRRTNSEALDEAVDPDGRTSCRDSCRASASGAVAAVAGASAGDAEPTGDFAGVDPCDRTTACFAPATSEVVADDEAVLRVRGVARLDVVRRVADTGVPDAVPVVDVPLPAAITAPRCWNAPVPPPARR